jgi:queuosine precursor transporter
VRAVLWRPVVSAVAAMTGYLLSVVAANVASVHWPPLVIGGLSVPAGTVFAGTSLAARDLVHDTLGARAAAAGTAAGAALSAVLASPHIAVASVVAFTASEIADAVIYSWLRRRARLRAVAVSNAVGLVVDSALFVPLAFGSFVNVPGQIIGKSIATLLAIAAFHAGSVIAQRAVRP